MTVNWESYAGQRTAWIGDSGARVRFSDRSPGLVMIEKGSYVVTITEEEARALATALLARPAAGPGPRT